jgi:hypothetical protein
MRDRLFALIASATVALLIVIAGCASTPQAPPDRDAEAKEFLTHPQASTLYVFRNPFNNTEDSVLYVDRRIIGATLPGAYFRINVVPGRHTLHGSGLDIGELTLETRGGQLYFIELAVIAEHSHFRHVPEALGRKSVIACCALLENWAPGQRPLLR